MGKNLSLKTCEKLVRENKTFTINAVASVERSIAALVDRLRRFKAVQRYIGGAARPEEEE